VRVINCAVGDTPGEVVFSDIRNDDQNHVTAGAEAGLRVPVQTLDSLIQERSVDLLKIDVEGYELMVLWGARHLLTHTCSIFLRPGIVILLAMATPFANYGTFFTRKPSWSSIGAPENPFRGTRCRAA
jgi:hypothetical protein